MLDFKTFFEGINRVFGRLNPFVDPTALIDIAIVSLIFYWLLGVIRGTRAVHLLRGIGVVLALSILLSSLIPLQTLRWLLQNAIQPALFVAIPVLFQPELRRALETLGRTNDLFSRSFGRNNRPEMVETINAVARAAQQLSQQSVGALMVLEREVGLQEYADRGVILDSRLAVPLLLNIFYPNSPLHDMAVILRGNRILAANVVLPLSEDVGGPRRYGTRHHEIVVGHRDFAGALPRLAWLYDELMGEPPAIPTWLMCREAKRHVSVLLCGEGADELFGGYSKYLFDGLSAVFDWMPPAARALLLGGVAHGMPFSGRRLRSMAEILAIDDAPRRYASWYGGFDARLQALSAELNTTYLPYGERGQWGASNQAAQDRNASCLNPTAAAQRAMTKATCNYTNARWDLVDACKDEKFDLASVEVEALPEAMRTMTPEQRKAHVAAIFEREMTHIFGAVWVYLAHESQIPRNDDFITARLGMRPLIVTRDSQGRIRALYNRCTHRGARVCRTERGNARTFQCPYHGWTYFNTGTLRGVPWQNNTAPSASTSSLSVLGQLAITGS